MAPRNFEESVEKGGPVFEPVFRPHFLIPYKAKGQKTGPYSGLKCWTAFGAKPVLFCVFFIYFFADFFVSSVGAPLFWERLYHVRSAHQTTL